eukprot:Nitzschia sp. Nitz4//NODE_491_length_15690_cov_71.798657//5550//6980//NITZ4_additional_000072-RA//-1//CDS//3329531944//7694//frame0
MVPATTMDYDDAIHQLVLRKGLKVSDVEAWPSPRKYDRYQLVLQSPKAYSGNGVRVCPDGRSETFQIPAKPGTLENFKERLPMALRLLETRTDVDSLVFDFELLRSFNDDMLLQLSHLLRRNDRTWEVELIFKFPLSMEESQLRDTLSILRPVKCLSLRDFKNPLVEFNKNDGRLVLQCLPAFDDLKRLDLQDWGETDPHDIQEILVENPDLPRFTRFSIAPRFPIQHPAFTPAIASQLRSIQVDFDREESLDPQALAQIVMELPLLEELEIYLPEEGPMPLALFSWMKSPQCTLNHLTVYIDDIGQLLPYLLETLPQMQSLRTLSLDFDCDEDSLDLEALLQAVADSPSIHHLQFLEGGWCDLASARRLLQFQLDCRPRLLSIWIHPEIEEFDETSKDSIAFISIVYQEIRNIGHSVPSIATLPFLLAKLGNYVHYATTESISMGNVVVVEALFDHVKQFLPQHAAVLASATTRE